MVKGNTVTKNLADGGISLVDDGPLDPGVAQGKIPVGGTLAPSKDNTIEDNTITDNQGGCGIVIAAYNAGEGVIDNIVSGNTVSHDVAGIVVATDVPGSLAEGNVVSHNVVSDNFIAGIVLHSNAPGDMLMKNAVTDNTVAGNGADGEVGAFQTTGIVEAGAVAPVTDNTITGNHVSDETLGIYVTGALANHISGNILDTPVSVAPSLEMVGQGGNVAAGKTVVYTVENPTAPTGLLYQYWVDSAAGWRMVQNYLPDNVYAMKDVAAGSYQVVAYSLTPAALKARAWHDAASASHIINVGSSVSLAVMGAMSGMTANSTTVQAAAKNLLHPVYQFWWQGPNGQWTASGNYSTDNMMDILPPTVAPPRPARMLWWLTLRAPTPRKAPLMRYSASRCP